MRNLKHLDMAAAAKAATGITATVCTMAMLFVAYTCYWS